MKPEVLLKAFVLHQSKDGFVELVNSTLDQVYSHSLGIIRGPQHLVEEAVLRAYEELARQAPKVGDEVVVTVWLREQVCKAAVRVLQEEDLPVDRAALKNELQGLATPGCLQAAPSGLGIRVSRSILQHAARKSAFWSWLPRTFWPAAIKPVHLGAAVIGMLGLLVLWNNPFHRGNPIIISPEGQMTPGSFGQRADSEDGGQSPPTRLTTKAQVNQKQP